MCEDVKSNFNVKKFIDFEAFKKLCEGGVCLRHTLLSKNCKQLYKQQQCYLKYQRKVEKQFENQVDEEWEAVKKIVFERDNNECQLLKKLSKEQLNIFYSKAIPNLVKIIDPAHYRSRGSCVELKYEPDNVSCINRYSHSNLDCQRSPITGKTITKEEWHQWWELILSKERKERLDNFKRDER